LVSLSDHKPKSSSPNSDLQRTAVQLQSAVEMLPVAGEQTTPVCKRLEAINSQICHNSGKLHHAAAEAGAGAVKRFVCLVKCVGITDVTVVVSFHLFRRRRLNLVFTFLVLILSHMYCLVKDACSFLSCLI